MLERWFERSVKPTLAYVIDTKKAEPDLSYIPAICDYPNVFPEELSGLPP